MQVNPPMLCMKSHGLRTTTAFVAFSIGRKQMLSALGANLTAARPMAFQKYVEERVRSSGGRWGKFAKNANITNLLPCRSPSKNSFSGPRGPKRRENGPWEEFPEMVSRKTNQFPVRAVGLLRIFFQIAKHDFT
jgi:hypothetical protein